jgi:ribosomal protein S18 acetylase RimI-like enzyme
MIEKLEHRDHEISKKIHHIFQISYKVEAELLNIVDFPPLRRTLDQFIQSHTEFFGLSKNDELAGVIEIDHSKNETSIDSLVVNPIFFRQGVANQLIEFTLKNFDTKKFVVETGLLNEPAIILYKKFGFEEVNQWTIEQGIRKVKFELIVNK